MKTLSLSLMVIAGMGAGIVVCLPGLKYAGDHEGALARGILWGAGFGLGLGMFILWLTSDDDKSK